MPDPDGLDFGPLGQSLGFLLRLSQLRSFGLFYEVFEDMGIRPGELSLLFMLADNPGVRQGVLARALRIKRAHMTKMIHGMEADGLVSRTVPEDDKRSVELWLTEKGRAQVETMRPMFMEHETQSPEPLTRAEADTLKGLLRKYMGL